MADSRHAEEQKLFNEVLSKAGWTPNPIRSGTADLEYENGTAKLRVVLSSRSPRFNFSIEEGERENLVNVEFGDNPNRTLNKLIELQDKFTCDSTDKLLDQLYPATKEIYVFVNDELVPIHKADEDVEQQRERPAEYFQKRLLELKWQQLDERTFELRAALAYRLKLADTNNSIYILFGLGDPGQIVVIAYPEGQLNDLLMLVTAWASKTTKDNYEDFLRELVQEFPRPFSSRRGKYSFLPTTFPSPSFD